MIIAEINYGGRVTEHKDMILLKKLLSNFLNQELLNEE
jgi:hypothetical protein